MSWLEYNRIAFPFLLLLSPQPQIRSLPTWLLCCCLLLLLMIQEVNAGLSIAEFLPTWSQYFAHSLHIKWFSSHSLFAGLLLHSGRLNFCRLKV
jgi:hypothetical protein